MPPAPVRVADRLAENTPAECHRPDDGENHYDNQPHIFSFHGNLLSVIKTNFSTGVPVMVWMNERFYAHSVFKNSRFWFRARPQ